MSETEPLLNNVDVADGHKTPGMRAVNALFETETRADTAENNAAATRSYIPTTSFLPPSHSHGVAAAGAGFASVSSIQGKVRFRR